MKKHLLFIITILIFPFLFSSCDEDDAVAETLLYGNDDSASINVELALNRVGGWYLLDNSQLYGLDVVVSNPNDVALYDISINLKSVSPSSSVLGFSGDDDPTIDYLSPGGSSLPDFHWFSDDMEGISQVYIGNFYVSLESYVSSGQTYSLTLEVSFTTESGFTNTVEFSRNFTTIFVVNPLPI